MDKFKQELFLKALESNTTNISTEQLERAIDSSNYSSEFYEAIEKILDTKLFKTDEDRHTAYLLDTLRFY